jgi:2-desacetyl-2-hydroxyethyl bacteriochlorophyllide A dehydrogenase
MATDVETIKAVEWMLEGTGRLGRTVTRLAAPAAGEILVATALGAISPGTERTLLHGNSPFVKETQYPYQPGYLNVVRILAAGDRTLEGERGIAILGHRDFALIPYARFIRIPAGVADQVALLGVVAADARHAIEVAAVESSEDCLVVGGGILGVLAAWELSIRTEGEVRIMERDPRRRSLIDGIRFPRPVEVSDEPGRGRWHTVFECANTADAFRVAQQSARDGGSIVLIADGCHERFQLEPDFFAKGLYLGKTGSNPDLRGFLGEWFSRHEERDSLVEVAFREEIRFADFPQNYLEALLSPPEKRNGLVTLVRYG